MWEYVQGLLVGPPDAAVEPVAVLWDRGEVDYSEVGAVVGHHVVGCGFSEVVEACPYELAYLPFLVVGHREVDVGNIGPAAVFKVVGRALQVVVTDIRGHLHGELVHASRGNRGGGLAAEHELLRQGVVSLLIEVHAVVEARYVEQRGQTVLEHAEHLVHSAGYESRRILAAADVGEEPGRFVAAGVALARNLVAYAPHDHRGAVAVLAQHVDHVLFGPLVEVQMIAVAAFGDVPLVERLHHHHEAHLVAQGYQLGRGHVV